MKLNGLIALALLCASCNLLDSKEKPAPKAPAVTVDLPPLIKLEGSIPPATYPDKVMRVDGLLARKDQYLDHKIKVRGYLVEKYQRKEGEKRFERPHVWIAEKPDSDKRLMITQMPEEIEKQMEVGSVYDLTGDFKTQSADGFVQSTGLLVFEGIEGLETEAKKR